MISGELRERGSILGMRMNSTDMPGSLLVHVLPMGHEVAQ